MMKFLLCLHSPVSSRLHLSSCSLIGSVEDRGVLTTILMIYLSCLNDLEQLLSREPLCKCTFSRSRLHPSSCSLIGSVEDRGVLTTILMIYFGFLNDLEEVLSKEMLKYTSWTFCPPCAIVFSRLCFSFVSIYLLFCLIAVILSYENWDFDQRVTQQKIFT